MSPRLPPCNNATKASTSAKDRARVEAAVLEWVERYLQLERILELDSASWNSPFPASRRLKSIEAAEGLADEVRQAWDLGIDPIPNLTELLEEKGLKVLLEELPESVSGFTLPRQAAGRRAAGAGDRRQQPEVARTAPADPGP